MVRNGRPQHESQTDARDAGRAGHLALGRIDALGDRADRDGAVSGRAPSDRVQSPRGLSGTDAVTIVAYLRNCTQGSSPRQARWHQRLVVRSPSQRARTSHDTKCRCCAGHCTRQPRSHVDPVRRTLTGTQAPEPTRGPRIELGPNGGGRCDPSPTDTALPSPAADISTATIPIPCQTRDR
jgi:hypothetical protein